MKGLLQLYSLGTVLSLAVPPGVCSFLRHHHPSHPATPPGGLQDGGQACRRPPEDGGPPAAQQRQVPGHHDRLPASWRAATRRAS